MMKHAIRSATRLAVEMLFPSRCVHCGAEGSLLCMTCLSGAVRLSGPRCRRCAQPLHRGDLCHWCAASAPGLTRMDAVFQMDGAIRSAVHALKYEGIRAIASVLAAEMAAQPGIRRGNYDLVIPVPLHSRRLRERGYNQSEMLAGHVAEALDVPLSADALRRTANTPRQVDARDEKERARQVANAFAASRQMTGLRALLIDDVCTTGSTLGACASALLEGGAGRADALVVAKEI
jgi:ComF family protein